MGAHTWGSLHILSGIMGMLDKVGGHTGLLGSWHHASGGQGAPVVWCLWGAVGILLSPECNRLA